MTNQNNQVDWNIIELEIIRFFNATPTYRNVEEWINFITKLIHQETTKAIEKGRLSVLEDFDYICMADAFMGFTDTEWQAVKKFFEVNKQISGWNISQPTNNTEEELSNNK